MFAAACWLGAAGCGTPPPGAAASVTATSPATGTPGPTTTATAVAAPSSTGTVAPRISKILVIMEENHSLDQVFPSHMPYLWGLARRYGQATAWNAVSHPSLPNYLAVFAGSTFNDPADCDPAPGCTYTGPTVFGQALAHGLTARVYEQAMPTPCALVSSGDYDVNHNPWAYFPAEAAACQAHDVALGTLTSGALAGDVRAAALPNVGMITPDLMHDGHNGTLAEADSWLASWLPVVLKGPDWAAGRLAVVVVFDEGETSQTVPFVMLAPGVDHTVLRGPLTHYALTRLMDEVAAGAPLRNAAGQPVIASMFGLTL